MPKPPTPAQHLEFARLQAFVRTVFDTCLSVAASIPAEHHLATVAARLWASSPAKALQGLRAATADMVEMTQDLEAAPLAALEARLTEAGAPSLACMRDRRQRGIFQILHRGRVRDDDEWRLVNAIVSDTADRILDTSSRESVIALTEEYEKNVRARRTGR